jgi:MFS family permease
MQALSLLLTFGVAGILGPFAGVLGDRYDRRSVMVWSEAVGAVMFAAMAFVATQDMTALLIGLAFGAAIAEQPFLSSSRAAIPNLIDSPDDLNWANSLVTIGVHAGIAIGPVIGGVLYEAIGPSSVFALNAVSFVISLILTLTVHGRFQTGRGTAEHGDHAGTSAGLRFLWRDWALRRMSVAWFIFVLGLSIGMVADAALAESFGEEAIGYALMITAWGSGSVLGSASGRWIPNGREGTAMAAGAFGISVFAMVVGVTPVFWLVLVALLGFGACDGVTIVAENTIMQERTPDAVRSRTNAAFEAVLSVGLAAGYLLAGPVLGMVSPQGAYRIGAVGAFIAALFLLKLRRLDRPHGDDGRSEPAPAEADHPVGDRSDTNEPVVPGSIVSFTSAEALEAEAPPLDRTA